MGKGIRIFIVISVLIIFVALFMITNVLAEKSSEATPIDRIEPIKDFKIELIGNTAIVTWEKSKDKRVIGYNVRYGNYGDDEYIGKGEIVYENRCVFVDLPLNKELWFSISIIGYDENYRRDGEYKFDFGFPDYSLYSFENNQKRSSRPLVSSEFFKYRVIAKEKTKPEEYEKLSKEAKKHEIPMLKVKDIKADPEKYLKKMIQLEGKLHFKGWNRPNTGCGYFTDDTGGLILSDVTGCTNMLLYKNTKTGEKRDWTKPHPSTFILFGGMNFVDEDKDKSVYEDYVYFENDPYIYLEFLKIKKGDKTTYYYFELHSIKEIKRGDE